MQYKEKRFSKRPNPISRIEQGARFVVETLFQGDLAVWDKELQELYPQLQIKRQPHDNAS